MTDVFLHVGLPKTGTTTIQDALDARVDALADHGVLFPGGSHAAQRLAAYDLLGQRIRGDDAKAVPGTFARIVEEIGQHDGPSAVLSEEALGLARPRHVRRVVRALPGHRVFVVVNARDLARTVVSAWQQSIVMGGLCEWRDFMDAIRDPAKGDVAEGTAFWLRHDLLRVVDAWATAIPPERIRIVTVPPPGSSTDLLLDRFAAAAGLPAGIWGERDVRYRNRSLGVAELEVIRRLNARIVPRLNTRQYIHVIEAGIKPRLRVDGSRPLRLPTEHLAWAREHGEALAAELERRGHPLFGDPKDLVPTEALAEPGRRLDEVTESELLAAAEGALASLAVAHGGLFRRYRRAFRQREGRLPSTTELVGSSVRAAGFNLQKSALRRARRSEALAWLARTYVRRTSSAPHRDTS